MSEPLSPERLAEIRERLAAASPGEWERRIAPHESPTLAEKDDYCHGTARENGRPLSVVMIDAGDSGPYLVTAITGDGLRSPANADLIAHAPTDLADLLAEVERLQEATKGRVNATYLAVLRTITSDPEILAAAHHDAQARIDAALAVCDDRASEILDAAPRSAKLPESATVSIAAVRRALRGDDA